MQKTALITGVAGQDGSYLADFLFRKKYKVIGVTMSLNKKNLCNLALFGLISKIKLIKGDITDSKFIKRILLRYRPNEFYNLAAISSVAESWQKPELTWKVNVAAVVNILELIKKYSPAVKLFQCSSAEMYGNSRSIITEKNINFNPINPYGASKLAAHLAVKKFREDFGLFACSGIMFNHESPLRDDSKVSKKITLGVARIAVGLKKKIVLGNLDAARDWGYAGDFVRAMWLMLQQKKPVDFVICTGRSYPVRTFVAEVFRQAGIKKWRSFVEIDKNLLRKKDIRNMRGSYYMSKKILGWQPATNFKKLVKLMLDFELKNLK